MGIDAAPYVRDVMEAQTADGDRILRLLTRFVGLGDAAYLLVSIPELGADGQMVDGWWTPVAVVLVFGPGLALIATSFSTMPSFSRMRGATGVAACAAFGGYVLANLLWLIAWNGGHVMSARSTWMVMFSGLAGLSAALVAPPAWAFAGQVVASFLSVLTNQLGLVGVESLAARVAYETVWAVAFSSVFVAAALLTVRTAHLLDATRRDVERQAVADAARVARDEERARFDALVHDRVLATLLQAHRTPDDPRVGSHARDALTELDRLAHQLAVEEAVGIDALQRRLRRVCAEHAVQPEIHTDGDVAGARYPAHVVGEMLAAAAEALRNSSLHAAGATQEVTAWLAPRALRLVIADTGPGFDSRRRESGRLGLDFSITRRMQRLRGGRSVVTSAVDAGTTVELEWRS